MCLECDDKSLGDSFQWRDEALAKIPRFNAFSRNMNTIKLNKYEMMYP